MTARVFPRQNLFAKKARAPGGMSADAAVQAGEARLAALQDDGLQRVDQLISDLLAQRPAPGCALDAAAQKRCEVQADELAGVAGLFGFEGVGQMAGRLCQRLADPEPVRAEVLSVFIDAVRLARAAPDADLQSLNAHLDRLTPGG